MTESDKSRTFRFLPLTLSVVTVGGIASPLMPRGTPLPAKRRTEFTTAADNQKQVEAVIVMGESPLASRNLRVVAAVLREVQSKVRGEASIQLTLEVDRACRLRLSLTEKSRDNGTVVDAFVDPKFLSPEAVTDSLHKAEATRSEDQQTLRNIEAENAADATIGRAERVLQGHEMRGEQRERLARSVGDLGLALESKDYASIRAKTKETQAILQEAQPSVTDFGDLFSQFFGTPGPGARQSPTLRTTDAGPIRVRQSQGRSEQKIGRIFGGSEFTLDPNLCFVLMPLKDEMLPIYEDHLRPVVEGESLSCQRADEIMSTGLVAWDIWEKINRARFVIADLTGMNPNVFYEVGLAHAIGKEVILLSQSIEHVPFDLRAIRCIIYAYTPRGMIEMTEKLRDTIKEIMRAS